MPGKLKFAAWLVALYGGVLATAAAAVVLVHSGISVAGLVFVAAEGRILLYNEQARALFSGAAAPLGLGRSLFALLDREEIAHALDKLQYAFDQGVEAPSTRFVTAVPGRGLVRVQMAPFLAAGRRVGGVVLVLDDVTRFVGQEVQRRSLLQALSAGV